MALELFGGGDEVEGGRLPVKFEKCAVDGSVRGKIKIFVGQLVDNGMHELGAHKYAAKHGLFCFNAVRRHAAQNVGFGFFSTVGVRRARLAVFAAALPKRRAPGLVAGGRIAIVVGSHAKPYWVA